MNTKFHELFLIFFVSIRVHSWLKFFHDKLEIWQKV